MILCGKILIIILYLVDFISLLKIYSLNFPPFGGRIINLSSTNHPSGDDGGDDGDGDEDVVAHDKNDDALQRAHEVYSEVLDGMEIHCYTRNYFHPCYKRIQSCRQHLLH